MPPADQSLGASGVGWKARLRAFRPRFLLLNGLVGMLAAGGWHVLLWLKSSGVKFDLPLPEASALFFKVLATGSAILIYGGVILGIHRSARLSSGYKTAFLITLAFFPLLNVVGFLPFLCSEPAVGDWKVFSTAEASTSMVIEEPPTFYRCNFLESRFWSDPFTSAYRGGVAFVDSFGGGSLSTSIPRGVPYERFEETMAAGCPRGTIPYLKSAKLVPNTNIECEISTLDLLYNGEKVRVVTITYRTNKVAYSYASDLVSGAGISESPVTVRAAYLEVSGKILSGDWRFIDTPVRLLWSAVDQVKKVEGRETIPGYEESIGKNPYAFFSLIETAHGPDPEGYFCASYRAILPLNGTIEVCDKGSSESTRVTGTLKIEESTRLPSEDSLASVPDEVSVTEAERLVRLCAVTTVVDNSGAWGSISMELIDGRWLRIRDAALSIEMVREASALCGFEISYSISIE